MADSKSSNEINFVCPECGLKFDKAYLTESNHFFNLDPQVYKEQNTGIWVCENPKHLPHQYGYFVFFKNGKVYGLAGNWVLLKGGKTLNAHGRPYIGGFSIQ